MSVTGGLHILLLISLPRLLGRTTRPGRSALGSQTRTRTTEDTRATTTAHDTPRRLRLRLPTAPRTRVCARAALVR